MPSTPGPMIATKKRSRGTNEVTKAKQSWEKKKSEMDGWIGGWIQSTVGGGALCEVRQLVTPHCSYISTFGVEVSRSGLLLVLIIIIVHVIILIHVYERWMMDGTRERCRDRAKRSYVHM